MLEIKDAITIDCEDMLMREDEVQEVLEEYFTNQGYRCVHEKQGVDLIATHRVKETWVIEAKGDTSSIRVDFCTCAGQLLGRIKEPGCNYGIAVPHTKQYINQARQLSNYVRRQLNIYIIYVNEAKEVQIEAPDEDFELL